MKLTLKLFAVAAAMLAGPAARAGSTYDPLTGELHDGGPSTIVSYDSTYDPLTGDLRNGRPSTEALGYGALVVESTDVTSEAKEQPDAELLHDIWMMP